VHVKNEGIAREEKGSTRRKEKKKSIKNVECCKQKSCKKYQSIIKIT